MAHLRTEVIRGDAMFTSHATAWDQLAARDADLTPFQTRLWQSVWLDHYRKTNLVSIAAWRGQDLVGLLNLYQAASAWRALRPVGLGPSDYLPPLGDDQEAMGAIGEVIGELAGNHLVDLHQIPARHPLGAGLEGGTEIHQATCLRVKLPRTFDAYVSTLSKSLRYDVRRKNGKAMARHQAKVEWVDPGSAMRFADEFFRLHELRWRSRGLPGAFIGRGKPFQKQWIQAATQAGLIRMNLLRVDGEAAGVVYGMKSGRSTYFYQAGMDPRYGWVSPGTVLISSLIQRGIDEGCEWFDMMRGDESYKRRWRPTEERTNLRILIGRPGVIRSAGLAWNQLGWRVESKVRERLEGGSLLKSAKTEKEPPTE